MYLKHKPTNALVEVIDMLDLIDPNISVIRVRIDFNDRMQRRAELPKKELVFPSGESLPSCWQEEEIVTDVTIPANFRIPHHRHLTHTHWAMERRRRFQYERDHPQTLHGLAHPV